MTQTAEQQPDDKQYEHDLLAYLRAHPDFFQRHATELHQLLSVDSDANTGAVSLSHYQLQHSRQRIADLEKQLALLIRTAVENEKVLTRLHQFTLDIGDADSPGEFMQQLESLLRERFTIDAFTLVIPDRALPGLHNPRIRRPASDAGGTLQHLLERPLAHSGRLTQVKAEALFGPALPVGSAAIAPIEGFGLLAVASCDVNRFTPDAGVLFLSLVGASLRHHLQSTHKPPDHSGTA